MELEKTTASWFGTVAKDGSHIRSAVYSPNADVARGLLMDSWSEELKALYDISVISVSVPRPDEQGTVQISPQVLKELEYIVQLHAKHGAPTPVNSVNELVDFVLASVADGSRRPGSWERSILESMGLVADTGEHQVYRSHYGSPASEPNN